MKIKERQKIYGRVEGCKRCGRKRGIIRRYGLHLCRNVLEKWLKKWDLKNIVK